MKVIRFIYLLLILLVFSSCEDDDVNATSTLDRSFVRFSFKTNSADEPLEFPENIPAAREKSDYEWNKRDTLKIPITLSPADKLNEEIVVNYATELTNLTATEVDIFPENEPLLFNDQQLTDTIYVLPQERFQMENNRSIKFELLDANADIHLGYPQENNRLQTFELILGKTKPVAYKLTPGSINIDGQLNEKVKFDVVFDQLIDLQSVEDLEFITTDFIQSACQDEALVEFDFDLTRLDTDGITDNISYEIEILEDITDLPTNLNVRLQEVNDDNLEQIGNNFLSISKDGVAPDRSGDPAANWYNANDILHRTYGEAWQFDDDDNICDWQSFQSFTRPVDVAPGSQFDNGNGYHRYKIGFRNIISNPNGDVIGTNPFNLRRFYDGPSVLSPAYNQMESLEFFPTDSNSGTVKVVQQTLTFITDSGQVNIPMCGNGSYNYNSAEDRWEMFLTLITDNSSIGGDDQAIKYLYIYVEPLNDDPEPLNFPCAEVINL